MRSGSGDASGPVHCDAAGALGGWLSERVCHRQPVQRRDRTAPLVARSRYIAMLGSRPAFVSAQVQRVGTVHDRLCPIAAARRGARCWPDRCLCADPVRRSCRGSAGRRLVNQSRPRRSRQERRSSSSRAGPPSAASKRPVLGPPRLATATSTFGPWTASRSRQTPQGLRTTVLPPGSRSRHTDAMMDLPSRNAAQYGSVSWQTSTEELIASGEVPVTIVPSSSSIAAAPR
jgi:hypothetical protein